jgi:ankyrin repeat protein
MDIYEVIRHHDLDRLNQILLRDNSKIDERVINYYETPLTLAATFDYVDIGQILINHGANINRVDKHGITPLMKASENNNIKFVTFLLKQPQIDVNVQGRHGLTALIKATSKDIVYLLLNAGADPNIADADNQNALMTHVSDPDILEALLNRGANVNAQDKRGDTVLDLAINHRYLTSVSLILSVPNVDVDLTNAEGKTALMLAASVPENENGGQYVQLLLEAGADPLMKDEGGYTALDYAFGTYEQTNVALLEQAVADWTRSNNNAQQNLQKKFIVARRLRHGTQTVTGSQLHLPSRDLTEGLIRKSEYDNLCKGLQSNLNKPGVIALARSLRIPTSTLSKAQLCSEIAKKLTL